MKSLIAACSFMLLAGTALAHEAPSGWTYDYDCCGNNDCEPVDPKNDAGGMYVITKDGKKWYVVPSETSVRASGDMEYHVCIHRNKVWCWYVPPGT